jgi:hypothetical protein
MLTLDELNTFLNIAEHPVSLGYYYLSHMFAFSLCDIEVVIIFSVKLSKGMNLLSFLCQVA